MSYNVLAVPAGSRFRMKTFTKIRNDASGWWVHQYDVKEMLPLYHTGRPIMQLGDMTSCTR
jgi:hypothetical protein